MAARGIHTSGQSRSNGEVEEDSSRLTTHSDGVDFMPNWERELPTTSELALQMGTSGLL